LGDASGLAGPGPSGETVSDGPTVTMTSDVTPEVPATSPVEPPLPSVVTRGVAAPARPPALRAALAAVNAMGRHDADELRRVFLAMAGAMVVVIVAARGLRRGSR
jgi:hypothetical protein